MPGGVSRVASLYGVSDCTLRLYSSSVVRSGVGTIETNPISRDSIPLPLVLTAEPRPLPLMMRICLPSRENTAPVGYHPVGMKPSTLLRAPLLMSTTATALLSALATSRVRPSGEIATEFGVDVGGASGYRFEEICSIASREKVSNTHTAALLPQDTNRRRPSFDSVIAFGCSPAGNSSISVSEPAS